MGAKEMIAPALQKPKSRIAKKKKKIKMTQKIIL